MLNFDGKVYVVADLLAAARKVGWQRPRAANMLIAGASRVEVVQEFTAGTSRASCKQLHAANLLTTGVSRWWVGKAHTMRIRLLIRNQRGGCAKTARCEPAYYCSKGVGGQRPRAANLLTAGETRRWVGKEYPLPKCLLLENQGDLWANASNLVIAAA